LILGRCPEFWYFRLSACLFLPGIMILGSAPDFNVSDFQSECYHWAPGAWGDAPSFDVSGFQPFLLLDLRFED